MRSAPPSTGAPSMSVAALPIRIAFSTTTSELNDMPSAKAGCEGLLQDALEGGGTDNITIVIGRTARRADA